MLDSLPEPPIPPGVDIRDIDGFMLNVERLLSSELWALATGDEFKAAVSLWMRAWKQVPAASLPDDDKVLAAFSGTGSKWPKVKEMALRGFRKCSDGRLYHAFLAEDAIKAWEKKLAFQKKRNVDTERLRKWRAARSETRDETGPEDDVNDTETDCETQPEMRFNGATKRISSRKDSTGTVQGQYSDLPPVGPPPCESEPMTADGRADALPCQKPPLKANPRGTRLPAAWVIPEEWIAWALGERRDWDRDGCLQVADRFRDFWVAKPGQNGTKLDWAATWRNWVRNEKAGNPTGPLRKSNPTPDRTRHDPQRPAVEDF